MGFCRWWIQWVFVGFGKWWWVWGICGFQSSGVFWSLSSFVLSLIPDLVVGGSGSGLGCVVAAS